MEFLRAGQMRQLEIRFRMKQQSPPAEEKAILSALSLAQGRASLFCLFAVVLLFSGCGSSHSNSNSSAGAPQIAGNWQFTMTPPSDGSFLGGIQGGFLLQTNNSNSVNGAVVYSVQLPPLPGGVPTICSSGSAPVTGNLNGQSVNLTVSTGDQSFTLNGGLSADGTTMMGTYTSTGAKGCGTKQAGLQWTALLVPSVTGAIQGNFHSALSTAVAQGQDFAVTGSLTQGENIGASNATVTGTLTFQGYPCLTTASVNGQISGNAVILQVIGTNGLNAGQIGAPIGDSKPSPVSVVTSSVGTVLQGAFGYGISTSACPGGNLAGDIGDVCLAIGNANGCTQPITLAPPSLAFLPQPVGSSPTAQTITLTNSAVSGTPLSGLSISFNPQSGLTSPFGPSDFNQVPNFTEQDNCASSAGTTFSLAPLQSCSITISFSPQQSCPWLPSTSLGGIAPSACPYPLKATLTVNTQVSADSLTAFAVPISGSGLSAIVPSTPEVDFGAEGPGESSAPQTFSFMNQGTSPVQILPALNTPCVNPKTGVLTLVRPPSPGLIAGLQVDANNISQNGTTINYSCDSDLTSQKPNFQISGDNCSGTLLAPQASCSLQITFALQPSTSLASGLDYFLQLNTQQCNGTTTTDCEIDSGRFPVELTANVASPLRMTPGAGLDFGLQTRGLASAPLTITIFNDPKDPHAGPVNFTGNSVKGDYLETDNCLGSLAPGASCTMNVTFQPRVVGFDPGTITITYTVQQTQIIHLRGIGQ
jgi:hypothetical protein